MTVEYDKDMNPVRIDAVVISTQHSENISTEDLRADILKHVIQATLPSAFWMPYQYHINPTGRFVIGGPMGDTGLTGRKIIVDTYGGMGRHGGGAFSGKDPTKVDRSAAYMARYIAKNIVAAGLAKRCEVQLPTLSALPSRSACWSRPSAREDRSATLQELVRANFKLTPKGIIESLNLRRPIYRKTAAYGHFGRPDPDFTWEATDKAQTLREAAGVKGKAQPRARQQVSCRKDFFAGKIRIVLRSAWVDDPCMASNQQLDLNPTQRGNRCWRGMRDASFVYAVTSTGIFCRPSCPSRRPVQINVRFFSDRRSAGGGVSRLQTLCSARRARRSRGGSQALRLSCCAS